MVLKLTQGAFLSVSYIYKWYLLYGKLKLRHLKNIYKFS